MTGEPGIVVVSVPPPLPPSSHVPANATIQINTAIRRMRILLSRECWRRRGRLKSWVSPSPGLRADLADLRRHLLQLRGAGEADGEGVDGVQLDGVADGGVQLVA